MVRQRKVTIAQSRKNAITRSYHRITINISGEIFETFFLTLRRFPETLLGDLRQLSQFYCSTSDCYYFDRNRPCFGAILFFYQSNGILQCPPGISLEVFETECKFFRLPELFIYRMKIKAGIIPHLSKNNDQTNTTEQTTNTLLNTQTCCQTNTKSQTTWRSQVWNIVEHPQSSKTARIFSIVSNSAIMLSTIIASMKTVDYFDFVPWSIIDTLLNTWFLLELVSRFGTCPGKLNFLRKKLNWVDAIAVIPYFILSLPLGDGSTKALGFFKMVSSCCYTLLYSVVTTW